MNSLLDGYEEQPVQPVQQPEAQMPSLLDGYTEPVAPIQNKVKNKVKMPSIGQQVPAPAKQSVQPEPAQPNIQQQPQDISVIDGLKNVASAVGRGVSAVPQNVLGFGKSLVDDTITTGKNVIKDPRLIPAVIPAMGKGLVDGLIHDVAQGVVDIPEAVSSAYQGRQFKEQVHIPTTVELTNKLAETLHNNGVYTDKQYQKYLELQQKGQGILDKLPIAQTAGQFMIPAGEVASTAKKAGIARAMLHGAGFGAVMPGSLENKVSQAGTGAVLAGGLGLAGKAGVPVSEAVRKAPEAIKTVSAQIIKPFNDFINAPTSFDSWKSIQASNVGNKISENALANVRLRNIQNDLFAYNSLLDIERTKTYQGQNLDAQQLRSVKKHIYKIEDSLKAQNDFINKNINNLDTDTLYNVQSNIQGRYNQTPIKDGYNVYGVPVDKNINRVEQFRNKYEQQQIQSTMDKIQEQNRINLENYRNKLIEEGKIRKPIVEEVPESIMDGYDPNEVVTAIDVPKNDLPKSPVLNENVIAGVEHPTETKEGFKTAIPEENISAETQLNPTEELNIKRTTVKTKHDKNNIEIEYVDDIPQGWTEKEGAMTAPKGYTWYTNGKSLMSGERKSVLVKDKVYDMEGEKPEITKSETIIPENTVSKYKYDTGSVSMKHGFTLNQREYIAKTILDEYKGNLYSDIKTSDIYNVEKNKDIEFDKYAKDNSNDVINLFIPNTNMKFTIYKRPEAIRTLFDKLGIKITETVSEKYTNPKNPSFNFEADPYGNKTIRYDGTWLTDGTILMKPEDVNIKSKEALDLLKGEPNQNDMSGLIPKETEVLTDTNTTVEIPKQKVEIDAKTRFKKLVDDPKKTMKLRVYENKKGEKVYIQDKYAKIFDDYRLYQGESNSSGVVAKTSNGEIKGVIMPVNTRGKEKNPMPRIKQSTLDKKVYKEIAVSDEKAITEWGKKKYYKTGEKQFSEPRNVLPTETQILQRLKKEKKAKRAEELKNLQSYDKILKDGVRKWYAEIEKRRYEVNKNLSEFINETRTIAKELKSTDKNVREILPFLRERTEIPKELNRPELNNLYNSLDAVQKEKLTNLADSLSEKFEQYWKEYQATHSSEAIEPTKTDIENYITHIWDVDKKQKSMMTNYFATRSRFAKERTIKTLFDGIKGIEMENGEVVKLTPKTLDYAEILKTQSDSMIKATIDTAFANEVKSLKANGVSLVMPFTKAPADWVKIDHPALNKVQVMPIGESNVGEVITPKLQNILAEMGVAIGRRLSPKASYLGVYRHKLLRPEIALQRWFSNKTLAHEIGHAIDYKIGLQASGFVKRHKAELMELNEERINALAKSGKKRYAQSDAELIAELFGDLFNDPKMTAEIAPKATMEVLERLAKNDTLKKLLPENFDWENAKHILEEKTVQMFKMPVKVHPDIADTVKTVFETPSEPSTAGRFFDATNSVLKQFQLGFSGFHIVALSEGGIANLGVKKTLKILNPVEMFNAVKNNDWDIYKKDTVIKQAIDDGLQIGATLDLDRNRVEAIFEDAGHWVEKNVPFAGKILSIPLKGVSKFQKINNQILWDYFHNNYKLTTYEMLIDQERKKGGLTQDKRREIAQWVNDSYGGQVWENLGIKPSGRRQEQRYLLSPDWLRSTTREFLGMFSGKNTQKLLNKMDETNKFWKIAKDEARRWGIGSITDDVTASTLRAKTARKFFINAVLYMSLYTNVINAMFRMKDQQDNPDLYPEKMTFKDYSLLGNSKGNETYVFIGRNSDGTERYWRLGKKFREVPEMVEKPIEKIGGKASPMVQLVSQIGTGHTASGYRNKDFFDGYGNDAKMKKGWSRVGASAQVALKSALPFSLSPAVNPNKDLNAFDFFAPTSRGTSFYKGREEYMEAVKHKDKEAILNITADLKRNKISPDEVMKSAMKELRKEAYKKAMQKLEKKKKEK